MIAPRAVFAICVIALMIHLLMLLMVFPGIYWGDDGMLIASSVNLGIGHPPGHPLSMHWLKLASLIPIGDIASRTNTWMGATATAVTLLSMLMLAQRLRNRSSILVCVSLFLALFLFSPWVIRQSIRSETYMLQMVLLVFIVRLLESQSLRSLCAASFLLGLSLSNQLLIGVLCVPGILILSVNGFRRQKSVGSTFAMAVSFGLLAYSVNTYIPIRAIFGQMIPFAELETTPDLFRYLTAQTYQQAFIPESVSEQIMHVARSTGSMIRSYPATVLFVLGPLLLWMRCRNCRTFGMLTIASVVMVGALSCKTFDSANWDFEGYLLPSLWIGALSIAELTGGASVSGRTAAGRIIVLGMLLISAVGFFHGRRAWFRLSEHPLARDYARAFLLERAADALLLMRSDAYYPVLYLQTVEKLNPDVNVFSRNYILRSGCSPRLIQRLISRRIRWDSEAKSCVTVAGIVRSNRGVREIAWELADDPVPVTGNPLLSGSVFVWGSETRLNRELNASRYERFCGVEIVDWHARDQLGMMWYNRGTELLRREICDEAIRDFRCALKLTPDAPRYLNNYAIALACAGRNRDALDVLDRLQRIQPGHPGLEHNKALIMERLNEQKQDRYFGSGSVVQ